MSDIFTTLKPVLYVSSVLGLGPFAIADEPKSFAVSPWRTGYSVLVLVLYAATAGYSLYERVDMSGHPFIHMWEYTYLVLFTTGILVAVAISFVNLVQRGRIAATVHNFHGVDSLMQRLEVRMPYDCARRRSAAAMVGLSLLLAGLFVHDYLVTYIPMGLFFWISYFVPIVWSTVMHYQFILGGLLLKKNFAFLNERLTRFGAEDADGGKVHLVDGLFESHLVGRTVSGLNGNFSRFRVRKVLPRDGLSPAPLSPLAKIKIIRKVHSNLCEIKESLNSSYSLQILSTVAQAFVIITTNLYSLFTGNSKNDDTSISYAIIWATFRALELVCITVTCTKISKTGNHTAVIVHKLLSQEWDATIRNQLKLFSIQLLHRKISFSACGFFTLDMTLLHAIIGAATTYLVILIQFHNTYETS